MAKSDELKTDGKYDAVALAICDRFRAHGVILMVIGGADGPGFSFVAPDDWYTQIRAALPSILTDLAEKIAEQNKPRVVDPSGNPSGNVN